MDGAEVPRTGEEVALLEASYRPFEPALEWRGVRCDADRWGRHAEALRAAVGRADSLAWERVRAGFLQAAALDSSALAKLIRPVPELTTVVLRSAVGDGGWSSLVEATGVVVECHRRALVVAADAAAAGRPMDEDLIARLQDLIVESQRTYTVTVEGGDRRELELPRRQYKLVSNFLRRTDHRLVPFAPVSGVAEEMRRLSFELASEAFADLHPVAQSAYIHLALIRIHPFADGNGRLGRTLACMPLLREVGLPQLILADQWPTYLRALDDSNEGDPRPMVELLLAAQINSMDLARSLVGAGSSVGGGVAAPARTTSAERILLDLVAVHLREAVGAPPSDRPVAVTRAVGDADAVRVALAVLEHGPQTEIEFTVEADHVPGWLRLSSSTGDALELWRDDVHPAPVEIVHLRVRSWLDGLLVREQGGLPESAPVRGLFVLGSPRSGTTMMGNWLGSHPDVLRLAEYGGFYIAHSVAPAYLSRLPGGQHEGFLRGLRALAADHASRAARRQGRTWFCDATPWNLQAAGAVAHALSDAVFVLMLRHFSGAVLSLRRLPWSGDTWADAARLWVDMNACIDQLPADRTIVVSYDVLAAHPTETLSGLREALQSLDLDPEGFDDREFVASHAHIIGDPRPTVASLVDGEVVFHSIPSLESSSWTPEVHAAVWPVVANMHRALLAQFGDVYEAPSRPDHVPADEW
jgi:Sulfotransferase family/Fic/DOC family